MDLVEEIKKIPPITRLLCGSLVAVTLLVSAGVFRRVTVTFVWKDVWMNYEIWRLYTSFFLSGGYDFFIHLGIMYQATHQLETGPYKGIIDDFVWQAFFAAAGIIVATRPLHACALTGAFVGCLVYLSAALSPPGAQASVMGLFTLPIKYWPYILIVIDIVMGDNPLLTVSGCIVGHLWWWAIWGGSLGAEGRFAVAGRAPQWVRTLVGEGDRPRPVHRALGGAAAALRQAGIEVVGPKSASGRNTGYQWGSGKRLGGS